MFLLCFAMFCLGFPQEKGREGRGREGGAAAKDKAAAKDNKEACTLRRPSRMALLACTHVTSRIWIAANEQLKCKAHSIRTFTGEMLCICMHACLYIVLHLCCMFVHCMLRPCGICLLCFAMFFTMFCCVFAILCYVLLCFCYVLLCFLCDVLLCFANPANG